MGILIDTSVLVDAERGRIDLTPHLAARAGQEVFLSVISVSEILYGAHRMQDPAKRTRRFAVAESLLVQFKVLPVDVAVARLHAQLKADLALRGTPVGPHDLWLAATSIAYGLTMVTANLREFQRVPGLVVESWS
jgi:tRNA(fMet)-specific endonuclease VapC